MHRLRAWLRKRFMARDSCKDTAGEPYFQARFKGENMLNLWQNFLDYQAREFTIVEYDAPLLEPYFQVAMVVLLTLRANCSLLALKPAMSSPYLPSPPQAAVPLGCAVRRLSALALALLTI
jgi:hypothetical protein